MSAARASTPWEEIDAQSGIGTRGKERGREDPHGVESVFIFCPVGSLQMIVVASLSGVPAGK